MRKATYRQDDDVEIPDQTRPDKRQMGRSKLFGVGDTMLNPECSKNVVAPFNQLVGYVNGMVNVSRCTAIPRKLYFDLWGKIRILHSVIILASIERQASVILNYHTRYAGICELIFDAQIGNSA